MVGRGSCLRAGLRCLFALMAMPIAAVGGQLLPAVRFPHQRVGAAETRVAGGPSSRADHGGDRCKRRSTARRRRVDGPVTLPGRNAGDRWPVYAGSAL